jgi:double-stranded uracil-DNA glycosylase
MMVLPDYLQPGLRVVLVGTAGCDGPTERRHYYAGRGNQFWLLLHESGLTPVRLQPEDDELLPSYGVGLTDLIRDSAALPHADPTERYRLSDFAAKIEKYQPDVVAFTSKTAAEAYSRAARERRPRDFGPLSWTIAGRPAFVLPGPSGSNNAMSVPLRIALWRDLVDFVDTLQRPEVPQIRLTAASAPGIVKSRD